MSKKITTETKKRTKPTTRTIYLFRQYGEICATGTLNNLPGGARYVRVTVPYGVFGGPLERKCVLTLAPNQQANAA